MAELEPITAVAYTEGPVVHESGSVYFSDIVNDRIMVLEPGRPVAVFRQPCGRTNGQVFDRLGVLYHCEGAEMGPNGNRRITRTDLATGTYEVVTETYDGQRYNSPNDISADGLGRLYFTDPRYSTERSDLEMDVEAVYRIDPSGAVRRILQQPDIERPNGIAVTVDGSTLFVVDSHPRVGGNRVIWRFCLDPSGEPRDQQLHFDFGDGRGGDGMELDVAGRLYVAAGINRPRGPHESARNPAGVYVISPTGDLERRLDVSEDRVTNVAFGGPDGRTLYVTAGKTLLSATVPDPGQLAYSWW